MTDTVGFGIVGCGSIAEIAHFASIAKTPEARLIACCDINPDTAAQAAAKYGAEAWYTDLPCDVQRAH